MEWVIPCNPEFYDINSAFRNLSQIDWRQSAKNIAEGDTVYIYVGRPVQEIQYKCRVIKTGILPSDADYSDEIYNLSSDLEKKKTDQYMRLEPIGKVYGVSREILIRAGMKGNIQGPRRVDDAIGRVISEAFEVSIDPFYSDSKISYLQRVNAEIDSGRAKLVGNPLKE